MARRQVEDRAMPFREGRCAEFAGARPDRRDAPDDAAEAKASPGNARRRAAQRGAITVEYVLVMALAAAILVGIEEDVFRPMARDILKNFMDFIVKPYP
ncbi:hypothetical protein [Solidesulfovibrio sp.]|uniref:hypothetical protein n=1 Tax=Solidesulfovibrio sp. TaxID=2910990 RepID=UPI00262C7198|nr:hypothetical protein [Solidesulfovibrio sp.]